MFKSKKIKTLSIILLLCFMLCVPVSASQNSSNTFIYPCGTPSTGSGTGYLEILVKNKETGALSTRMFSWNLYELSNTDTYNVVDIRINIEFNMSGSNETIKFSAPYITGNDDVIFGNIYSTIPTGNITFKRINSSDTNYTYSTSGELVGFHVYGNYTLTDNLGIGNQEFYILYAESGAIYNAIQNGQQSQTNQIIQGQQQQTEDIKDNQNENTDKLIQAQKDQAENEKQEANDTGDSGVNSILGEIPNDSDGIVNSFKNLTTSMIHNNTTCNLSFPGIKIPPLKPFTTKETVLLDKQDINMETAINLIPNTYLKLIRALCDIAIIVFCFKEMYSQLGFLFTAKGGGDSE